MDEHLVDNDELLLHLLVADLQAEAAHESRDFVLRDGVLALMDSALANGDEAALNHAVAVSFVEDSGWWEPGKADYVACWPDTLTLELNRQRGARP